MSRAMAAAAVPASTRLLVLDMSDPKCRTLSVDQARPSAAIGLAIDAIGKSLPEFGIHVSISMNNV